MTQEQQDEGLRQKKAFLKAFCAAKSKLEQPNHDSKVKFKSVNFTYASLSEILKVLKVFNDEGISFIQSEVLDGEHGGCFMGTTIFHVDGYEREYRTFLKANFQSEKDFASSITYARRYALCSIFGLYGSADIDALPEIIYSEEKITVSMQTRIEKMMEENPEFNRWFKKVLSQKGKKSVGDIPASAEPWLDKKMKEMSEEENATEQ